MPHALNRALYRAFLAARHPGTVFARWRGRGLAPLDAACIECAGPAAQHPPPLMTREVFRLTAGKTFPYARLVVFAGRSDPLLHGDLREMLRVARSYGKETCVVTDCAVLDEGTICMLIGAGTGRLTVSPVPPEASPAARHIEILGKVKARMGVSHPALEIVPAGAPAIPGRRVEIAWDGTVYPGGLRDQHAAKALGHVGALSPRMILRRL